MKITSEEQNKVKRMKRAEDSLRGLWDNIKHHQHLNYRGPGRRSRKERVWENFRRDYSWKFPQHGKGNSQSNPRGTKSSMQDKPMEKHTKTYTNQTSKDSTQRKNIKSSKGKAPSNIQGKLHMFNSCSFIRNSAGQKEMAGHI